MNVDAVNFTLDQLKSLGVSAFNQINGVDCPVTPDSLIFSKSTCPGKVLLQDAFSKAGILMEKVSLTDIFPTGIDIRPYKETITQQQTQVDVETGTALNNKYSTTLTIVDPDILNTATNFSVDVIKDFFTFCRVFGFYELTLSDVSLNKIDDKLVISVNSTHDYFTGFIEVQV